MLVNHEMVLVPRQEIVEVIEYLVAVPVTDADPGFFRNIPSQFRLIRLPGLIEGRLSQSIDRRGHCRRQRSQQCAGRWWRCGRTIAVDLSEIGILRNPVSPKIEFLDQTQMFGQMHRRPDDRVRWKCGSRRQSRYR